MKLRAYIVALHAALFAIFLALSYAHAGSMTLLGAGKPAAGGGGGGGVTWDPAAKGSTWVLSGSNLIATVGSGGGGGYEIVLGTAGHSTGKFYFEVTASSVASNPEIGLANASESLNGSILGAGGNNSVGWVVTDGRIFIGGSNVTTVGGAIAGNVVAIAVDFGGHLLWTRSTFIPDWNNDPTANPATGVGGISIAALNAGTYLPAAAAQNTATGEAFTLNTGGSAYSMSAPAGFGNF